MLLASLPFLVLDGSDGDLRSNFLQSFVIAVLAIVMATFSTGIDSRSFQVAARGGISDFLLSSSSCSSSL